MVGDQPKESMATQLKLREVGVVSWGPFFVIYIHVDAQKLTSSHSSEKGLFAGFVKRLTFPLSPNPGRSASPLHRQSLPLLPPQPGQNCAKDMRKPP